jgi:hypothetical protein
MSSVFPPPSRQQQLLTGLPHAIDQLERGETEKIPTGFLADYLALHWLTDRGHGLRLTPTGEAVFQRVKGASYGVT